MPSVSTAMKISNPGIVTAHYSEPYAHGIIQFHHVFWAFTPFIEGFQYCQPLLSIDGIYLYEKYRSCLLIAKGVDADGGLYPLVFAVVEGETEVSWQ